VAALAAAGQQGEAQAILQRLNEVNPRYAAAPPLPPLHPLPPVPPEGANG